MVSANRGNGQALSRLPACVYPCVRLQYAVVRLVVDQSDSMRLRMHLEGDFALDCFLGGCCLLQVDKAMPRILINVHRCVFVTLVGQASRHLCDEAWCWGDHLVDR